MITVLYLLEKSPLHFLWAKLGLHTTPLLELGYSDLPGDHPLGSGITHMHTYMPCPISPEISRDFWGENARIKVNNSVKSLFLEKGGSFFLEQLCSETCSLAPYSVQLSWSTVTLLHIQNIADFSF